MAVAGPGSGWWVGLARVKVPRFSVVPHTDRFLLGEFSGSFEGWLVLHTYGLLDVSARRSEESQCSVLALALCSVGTGLGYASSNTEGLRSGSRSPSCQTFHTRAAEQLQECSRRTWGTPCWGP